MESTFATLLDSVRDGDQAAAAELVKRYEPVVRREIRLWLRQWRTISLHRVVDSTDICQSVLARFFEAVSADRLNLDSPEHLQNLLVAMARNRFHQHVRSSRTLRRDARRNTAFPTADLPEPANRGGPADGFVEQELIDLIRGRLTPEERELADRRAAGESWADVTAAMGGTVDGRRMQLARAEARIASVLGLGE